mmetsp:Transcript_81228/g.169714  ORF Transcript_81228/g.169714 Transcript_81228/m.169714 type:complete len:207 (-) Transcript_81228:1830-2450(-)
MALVWVCGLDATPFRSLLVRPWFGEVAWRAANLVAGGGDPAAVPVAPVPEAAVVVMLDEQVDLTGEGVRPPQRRPLLPAVPLPLPLLMLITILLLVLVVVEISKSLFALVMDVLVTLMKPIIFEIVLVMLLVWCLSLPLQTVIGVMLLATILVLLVLMLMLLMLMVRLLRRRRQRQRASGRRSLLRPACRQQAPRELPQMRKQQQE